MTAIKLLALAFALSGLLTGIMYFVPSAIVVYHNGNELFTRAVLAVLGTIVLVKEEGKDK